MQLNEITYKTGLGDIVVGWDQFKGSRKSLEDRVESKIIRRKNSEYLISIVADGMGGGNEGEIAAQMTLDTISNYCENSPTENIPEMLTGAISAANAKVSSNPDLNGAGSTAVVIVIKDSILYLANVGDSRAYLIRNSNLHQLTTDHTKGYFALREGKLTPDEIKRWSKRDDLGIFVGQQPNISVDTRIHFEGKYISSLPLKQGDGIILCSDGLIKTRPKSDQPFVYDREIINAFLKEKSVDAASVLISFAKGRQADDNVSVVVIGVGNTIKPSLKIPESAKSLGIGLGVSVVLGLFVIIFVVVFSLFPATAPVVTPTPMPPTPTIVVRSGFAYISKTNGQIQSQTKAGWASLIQGNYTGIGAESFIKSGPDGMAILDLPDGSRVFIGPNTILSLTSVAEPTTQNKDTLITINSGKMVAVVSLRVGNTFSVYTKDGRVAKVDGSVMGVSLTSTRLEVDCFEGHCSIGTTPLAGDQYSWLDGQVPGEIKSPARCDDWRMMFPGQDIFSQIGVCATPTPVPSPTPNYEATQSCQRYIDVHHITPCPPQP